jgi:hypothetical protein
MRESFVIFPFLTAKALLTNFDFNLPFRLVTRRAVGMKTLVEKSPTDL